MNKQLIGCVALALVCGAAFAGGGQKGTGMEGSGAQMGGEPHMKMQGAQHQQRFRTMDTDGDGYISQTEASGHQGLSNNWQQADRNADGRIDEGEFSMFEEDMPAGK